MPLEQGIWHPHNTQHAELLSLTLSTAFSATSAPTHRGTWLGPLVPYLSNCSLLCRCGTSNPPPAKYRKSTQLEVLPSPFPNTHEGKKSSFPHFFKISAGTSPVTIQLHFPKLLISYKYQEIWVTAGNYIHIQQNLRLLSLKSFLE